VCGKWEFGEEESKVNLNEITLKAGGAISRNFLCEKPEKGRIKAGARASMKMWTSV